MLPPQALHKVFNPIKREGGNTACMQLTKGVGHGTPQSIRKRTLRNKGNQFYTSSPPENDHMRNVFQVMHIQKCILTMMQIEACNFQIAVIQPINQPTYLPSFYSAAMEESIIPESKKIKLHMF